MTCFDQPLSQRSTGVLARLTRVFDTPHDRRVRRLARQAAALRALSDADLAALGIARDRILWHLFSLPSRASGG